MNWLGYLGRTLSLTKNGQFFSQFYGGNNWAGESINADTAMRLTFVWRCVRLISSTISSLPLNLISVDGEQRQAGASVPIQAVISDSPNADQTAMEFWEAIIGSQELAGNGFARKEFAGEGAARRVIALTLMNPYRMGWEKKPGQEFRYIYTDDEGRRVEYARDDIFHLRQFSFDGVMGLSTIQFGGQTFGGARAADRTASQMFATGLSGSGFLETAQQLDEPDRARLQKILDEYKGSAGVGKIMILEGGMKYSSMSVSAADAQLLSSRKWNGEEICRLFDVPPILAGHSQEGGTTWGSGVEAQVLSWYILGLRNRLRRIQQSIRKQLLTPTERTLWTPKYNIDALLQGDSAARASQFSQYVQNGVMNRNEARAKLDLPPYAGGDEFTAQVNLAPVDMLGDKPDEASATRNALRNLLGLNDAPPAPLQIEHKP